MNLLYILLLLMALMTAVVSLHKDVLLVAYGALCSVIALFGLWMNNKSHKS